MKYQLSLIIGLCILLTACKSQNKHPQESQSIDQTQNVSLDKIEFEIDCSIRALSTEPHGICWFAGSKNKIGYTKDYGKSWQSFDIEFDSLELEFRSIASTKEAVFVLSIGTPALLFKINKKTLEYSLVYQENGENVFYDSMQFWDEKNGIAVGDPTGECMSVLITKDGGNHWNKLDCQDLPMVDDGEAAFAASNSNISLAGTKAYIVTGGKSANVLIGENYGRNWRKVVTPIIQGGKMTGIFTSHFVDIERGIIAGGNWEDKSNKEKAMAITRDGGNSWQLINDNPGYISCIQFIPNTSNLLSCSTNGIFYSDSFGKSWKKISNDGFYAFRFSDNGERIYFSENNKLMSISKTELMKI